MNVTLAMGVTFVNPLYVSPCCFAKYVAHPIDQQSTTAMLQRKITQCSRRRLYVGFSGTFLGGYVDALGARND
jgi:hypothetical protein